MRIFDQEVPGGTCRILTYREYWNPLVTIAASGGYDSYMKAFYAKSGASD